MTLFQPFWKKYPNLSPAFKRFDQYFRTIHSIAKKHYEIKEEELNNMTAGSSNRENSGILASMIQETWGNPGVLPELMVAGHDATSVVTTTFLYHLASNPDKQQTANEKITRKIGDKPITRSSLKRLRFFTACFKESQRLNPPSMGLPREIQSPTVIGGYQVPPGTVVMLNQMTLNQMHVPSPAEFVPERWLRGSNHSPPGKINLHVWKRGGFLIR